VVRAGAGRQGDRERRDLRAEEAHRGASDVAAGHQGGSHLTNLENGRSVEVKINDPGPYAKGRKIDLSHAAAERIGMTAQGVTKVKIEAEPYRHTATRQATQTPSVTPAVASPTATVVSPQ